MKTYIAKAEIKVSSQEEAWRKASEMCGSDFIETEGTGSWEIYNVEEAE